MIIHIGGKTSDMATLMVREDGETVIDHNGYVPDIPSIGGGDYISLAIDNDTGKIIGWKPLTLDQIKKAINEYD